MENNLKNCCFLILMLFSVGCRQVNNENSSKELQSKSIYAIDTTFQEDFIEVDSFDFLELSPITVLDEKKSGNEKRWYYKPKQMYGVGQWHLREQQIIVKRNGEVRYQALTAAAFGCVNCERLFLRFWDRDNNIVTDVELGQLTHTQSLGEKLVCFKKTNTVIANNFDRLHYGPTKPGARWVVTKKCRQRCCTECTQ